MVGVHFIGDIVGDDAERGGSAALYEQVGGRRRAQQGDRRGRRLRSREEMLLGEAVVGAQGYVAVVEHSAQAMPWLPVVT